MGNCGVIIKAQKNIFNLLFIFLSLSFRGHPGIDWSSIPGLSMSGESPVTMRARLVCHRYFPNPLGIALLCDAGLSMSGQSPVTMRTHCSYIVSHPDCARFLSCGRNRLFLWGMPPQPMSTLRPIAPAIIASQCAHWRGNPFPLQRTPPANAYNHKLLSRHLPIVGEGLDPPLALPS